MKKSIPRYTFYKHKYGSELLVDVVELKNIKKFLDINPVHTLTMTLLLSPKGQALFRLITNSMTSVLVM